MVKRMQSICFLVLAGLFVTSALFAGPGSWSLPYGTGDGQAGFHNANVDKEFQEASPFGPMAFRIHDGEAWIADSCNGRIFHCGADGKIKSTIPVPGVATNTLLEDLALEVGADKKVTGVWVADGQDLQVRRLSIPEGKELAKFGGNGSGQGQFLQIHQLEVSASGKVYVGDFGKNTISVFDPTGKFLREQPWQLSGFFVDEKDQLFTLSFVDDKGFSIDSFDAAGKSLKSVFIGLPKCTNPRIWGLDKDGTFVISFIPAEGFKGTLDLVHFSVDGKEASKTPVAPLKGMNRILELTSDGSKFLAEGDFNAAPQGSFSIRAF